MKLITTALGSYLTGDDIADAVLDYSHALAREQRTDLIEIPIVVDHSTTRLRFTVGWTVQLHTVGAVSSQPELVDDDLTRSLRERTHRRVGGDSDDPRATEPWLADMGWFDYES